MGIEKFRIVLILVSVFTFNLISNQSLAQDSVKSEEINGYIYFQPNFGVSQYFGDVNKNNYWNQNPRFAFGAVLGYQPSPVFGFRGQFLKADLYSKRSDQNEEFYSNLWDAALNVTINVNAIFAKTYKTQFLNFYLFSGAGLASYKSTLENIKPREVVYQHSERQNKIYFPIGGGVSYRLNPHVSINLEYGDHIIFKSGSLDFIAGGKKNNQYSYTSLGIQIKYNGIDTDGDGIKDKKDACPDVPGKIDLVGCPDKDNDGIADKDDLCPEIAGISKFKGCPDTDGDDIPDKDDACPDIKGLAQFAGCPDTDGDGIPDKDDACPDQAGKKELHGCLDTDGDGIIDSQDACPTEAGKKELNGCPDRDNDGVADKDDKCPDVAGIKEAAGCPDRDGDGINDNDDACPDIKGLAQFAGCPDTDGDGIPDKDDACPEEAGKKKLKGCPDKDGDGIADKDDKCPDVAGSIEFNGCPDSDGDGIIDNEDLCPYVKGLAKYSGCPDTDGDGIPDNKDECPDIAGKAAFKGCPVAAKDLLLAKTVYFYLDEIFVIEKYIVDLENIAVFMNDHPNATISISGYADDNGTAQNNFRLSLDRVDNIINYLKARGMKSSKIQKYFFGKTKPVPDAKSNGGSSLNRRVTIVITE